jgi:hypothetical protein
VTTRFHDEGRYLAEFLAQALVLCPSCDTPGVVIASQPYWRSTPRFTCSTCALRLEGWSTRWFGPAVGIARRRCGRCGRPLQRTLTGDAGLMEQVELVCPGCASHSVAKVKWSFDVVALPHEPAFGLTLRLQTPCVGQVLWAYNTRHLRFLADYVSATVRARTPNRNASLVSRLPAWLKKAKNRTAVLKAIKRLEAIAAGG